MYKSMKIERPCTPGFSTQRYSEYNRKVSEEIVKIIGKNRRAIVLTYIFVCPSLRLTCVCDTRRGRAREFARDVCCGLGSPLGALVTV